MPQLDKFYAIITLPPETGMTRGKIWFSNFLWQSNLRREKEKSLASKFLVDLNKTNNLIFVVK